MLWKVLMWFSQIIIFDLPAGRDVKITVPLPEGWKPVQVLAALKVRSIYDSFAVSTKK